jgi:hypothetical protein
MPRWSMALLAVALLMILRATYVLAFADSTEELRFLADGCDAAATPALCAARNAVVSDVTGLAWRSMLVATVIGLFATVKIEWEDDDGELPTPESEEE